MYLIFFTRFTNQFNYHELNAPPPKTEFAAMGSINPSSCPGLAEFTSFVVSPLYILL